MTVAIRREPTFHGVGRSEDAHHAAGTAQAPVHPGQPIHPVKPASGFTRFVSGFQALSTLIGVPLALASGYTLYRTNFSPDTTCTNLRVSIISMLDKNVDAATRRMLVKRDIEAFEQSCGAFDPDAHAAFKTLLSADKAVAAAPKAPAAPKPVAVVPATAAKAPAKEVAKDDSKDVTKDLAKDLAKTELRPALVEKKPVTTAPAAPAPAATVPPAAETVAHDAAKPAAAEANMAMSDTRWLAAVRQALVEQPAKPHEATTVPQLLEREAAREAAKAEPAKVETAKPQPLVPAKPGEPVLQPAWSVTAPPAAAAAPAGAAPLPPAVDVAGRPAPANGDHPVPPASVPEAQYVNNNGSWIAQIPFVGRMIDGPRN